MATIGPFENSKATNLTFAQLASIYEASIVVSPLFESFSINMAPFKITANLDQAIIHLFYALALDLILGPHAIILLPVCRLLILAFAMELSILELAIINGPISESLATLTIRVIICKVTCVD